MEGISTPLACTLFSKLPGSLHTVPASKYMLKAYMHPRNQELTRYLLDWQQRWPERIAQGKYLLFGTHLPGFISLCMRVALAAARAQEEATTTPHVG